jgi:hypothetical protein
MAKKIIPWNEAKWKVRISYGMGHCYWQISTEDNIGLYFMSKCVSKLNYVDKNAAKRAWRRYAKLNNIKNWEWV